MNSHELSESILKTLNIFDFLQFVDEQYSNRDRSARRLVDSFFQQRYGRPAEEMEGILPLVQLKTGLALLLSVFCYASSLTDQDWQDAGFKLQESYEIEMNSSGACGWTPCHLTRVIVNACTHMADSENDLSFHPALAFDSGVVVFTTQESQVRFTSEQGYVLFLRDWLRAMRRHIGSRINSKS